jgi:hypothetical protein
LVTSLAISTQASRQQVAWSSEATEQWVSRQQLPLLLPAGLQRLRQQHHHIETCICA